MSKENSEKYRNIHKLNKKIDVLGYFKGIKNIENEEFRMSGLMLLMGMLFLLISLSIAKDNLINILVSFVFMALSFLTFYRTLNVWNRYVNELLKTRINDEDLNSLLELRNNGEKTKAIVDKILAEHRDGFLTYLAIAKYLEELVEVYNKERSLRVKEILEAK
jgi:hypothetical protein